MREIRKSLIPLCTVMVLAGCAPKSEVVPPQSQQGFDPLVPVTEISESPILETEIISSTDPTSVSEQDKRIMLPQAPVLPTDLSQHETPVVTVPVQGPLPTMSYVDDRIFEYGRKLEQWRKIDEQAAAPEKTSDEDMQTMVNCFRDLRKVLDGYHQLKSDMLQLGTTSSTLVISTRDVLDLQKSDISFLESICGKILAPEKEEIINWEQREEEADLPQLETLIERYTDSKEYEEVIQLWQQIPEQQKDRLHLRTKILYANALMFLHQEENAAAVYQQIVDEMMVSDEQRTDLLSLRKMLADLYTASDNYTSAAKQYLNIADDYKALGSIEEWSNLQLDILERSDESGPELASYSNLLRDYLGFIPSRDGFKLVWDADTFLENYPYSPVASNVDIIRENAHQGAVKWFDGFFAEVDTLAAEKNYIVALEKLDGIPGDIIGTEQKERIKQKNDELLIQDALDREMRRQERTQKLDDTWNEGLLLANKGDYDEAIAVFNSLLQSEYAGKAQDKINEITLDAARNARRDAANTYKRYTKTEDIELKKKLLVESRRLLVDILEKYPEVSIISKVKQNIKRVEQEMNKVDPLLLPRVQVEESNRSLLQKEEELQMDDQGVSFPAMPAMPSLDS